MIKVMIMITMIRLSHRFLIQIVMIGIIRMPRRRQSFDDDMINCDNDQNHDHNQHQEHNDQIITIVGKKWEPRNTVPGPFSAKIRKVNQNSECR